MEVCLPAGCLHLAVDKGTFLGFDEAVAKSWKETTAPIPECATCFYYPSCILLKKCANRNKCFLQHRQERLRKTQRQMACQYQAWLDQGVSDDTFADIDC
jgi:hypothetical protein